MLLPTTRGSRERLQLGYIQVRKFCGIVLNPREQTSEAWFGFFGVINNEAAGTDLESGEGVRGSSG